MTRNAQGATHSRTAVQPSGFVQRIREIDMFFQRKGLVHQTMRRLVKRLEKARVPYAIVGGMAVNAHHYQRTTCDVDILLNRQGFDEFRSRFVSKFYEHWECRPRRFVDRINRVRVDVFVAGHYPGIRSPAPIAFPDPEAVSERIDNHSFVNLPTLIQLKLAARRYRDLGDVVELIRFNNLDKSYLQELHPALHRDFIECLEEKRRDDEFEARE